MEERVLSAFRRRKDMLVDEPWQGSDECMLDVYPIALGKGIHLLRDVAEPIALSLVRLRQFPQGVTLHVYTPDYRPNRSR